LLPLGNWDKPPPGSFPLTGETNYANWLIRIFDHWFKHEPQIPDVRLFNQIIDLSIAALRDKPFTVANIDAIGPWTVGDIVVETDGSYELLDGYKTTAAGQAQLGLNVFEHTLTRALVAMLQTTEARGIVDPCPECQACPLVGICGGGLYLDRFKQGSYINRSVYCEDLKEIISHIASLVLHILRKKGFVAT
jgi:uncharacterized protein